MVITDLSQFDYQRQILVVHKIATTKEQFVEQEDFYKGSRFNDNIRILRILLGIIFSEEGRDYVRANGKFVSMDSKQIMPYIKRAVVDSGRADYHYKFEKQYV